jgi:hypothetical protein
MRLLFIILLFVFPVALTAQVVSGQVKSVDGEVISFANIALYQKVDSTLLFSTTTNDNGCFEIKVKDSKRCFLRVSFVGYQTKDIEPTKEPLAIALQPLLLGDVFVTADKIKKDASSEVFYITDSLREASANTLQLLDKLKGIQIDWMTDAVKIGEYRDVPMMIEGRDVRVEYVRNLNPKRIRRVEVLRYPKGKYGDAPIVLNIILQNSYTGFDMSAHAKGLLSLRSYHSYSSDMGMTFTRATNKWNIYGDAEVNDRRLYEATSYNQIYKDFAESTVKENFKTPNGSKGLKDLKFSVGMDYKINPKHIISMQTWIDHSNGKDKKTYEDTAKDLLSRMFDNYRTSNITTGVYYRGSVKEKLYLSGDVTCNFYDVEENKQYSLLTYNSNLQYDGKKKFYRTNADARYVWNEKLKTTIGYTFTSKNYTNYNHKDAERLFSSEEIRHSAYVSVNVDPLKNLHFVVGSNFLNVHERNDVLSDENFSWMPLAKASWRPFRLISIYANYFCDVQHPNLDQLSVVSYQCNGYLWHQGNPGLKASVMHYMQYRVELKNILQFTYLYKRSSREITSYYNTEENKVIETLVNGDYIHQYVGLNGDYILAQRIGVNFTTNYQWYKRRKDNYSSWRNGYTWYLDIAASWQVNSFFTILSGYFLRYDKEPLLQGKKYNQSEQLMMGVQASMPKNRVSIILAMTIPTNAISKRVYNEIDIPDYRYISWSNEKVNNAMIQLSLRYNLGKGKVSKMQNANKSETER